ncbi:MAG: inorganic phosphate transporter [Acidobacteriaceae bacterium]
MWTGLGAAIAAIAAHAMLQIFSSISRSGDLHTVCTAIATIAGAILWIALATYKSLPVSTTHAIIGSITGVAIFSGGMHELNWGVLGGKIGVPMLVSPLVAVGLTVGILRTWRASKNAMS